ncbi:uncharacterized protein LOC120250779 [Dioscorea cayenensis subsp. rotundata]|uniref:Uncharacterized protein LOC120250779 n=1 Tax=Dioscorea cayennensis subsp. rotundata TaxID=55577 RepID=A0AB40AKH8_DIOCR|nr:uncharacterized protein LOC120250779 [Dioscorea cayenensis subsp. rotundata]
MAPPSGPSPGIHPGVSWANAVNTNSKPSTVEILLHLQRDHFDKLKTSSKSSVTIDSDLWANARDAMQSSLYAKFLGKSLPLDQTKLALADTWRGLGAFSVADLPNGYYFIRCESLDMVNHLLWDGHWMVAGRILQLAPWKESFQPAFEKLSMAAVWIQIFHLPMELWTGDILEMVASQFGRVLKVDDHSLDRSRAKFARVCVEVDLSQPLQLGTWVNYGDHSVFVLILYEKLPVFCYRCGRIGHGEAHCSFSNTPLRSEDRLPPEPSVQGPMATLPTCELMGLERSRW